MPDFPAVFLLLAFEFPAQAIAPVLQPAAVARPAFEQVSDIAGVAQAIGRYAVGRGQVAASIAKAGLGLVAGGAMGNRPFTLCTMLLAAVMQPAPQQYQPLLQSETLDHAVAVGRAAVASRQQAISAGKPLER